MIRYNILNSLLSNSDVDIDFDSTMVFPNNLSRSDTSDDNLKR